MKDEVAPFEAILRVQPAEPKRHYVPPGEPLDAARAKYVGPAPCRDDLLAAAWLKREMPARDCLLGELLCTTSRWLLIGQTGVGKTLFTLDMAAAVAAGADFLGWKGKRRARVMYLDGEMPAETFKERIEIVTRRYGEDIKLYGYNRDVLGPDDMPPLDAEAGQAWLLREIEGVKPDLIVFDSVMCLLSGAMAEEESWRPVTPLVRKISSLRIAQIWLHHTGHDATRGFGTKTREWEMDTVAMLTAQGGGDEGAGPKFQIEFTKKRLCTPKTFSQFATKLVTAAADGFEATDAPKKAAGKKKGETASVLAALRDAFERHADPVTPTAGHDDKPVKKVSVDAIRDDLRDRGFLDKDEAGNLTNNARQNFHRAKRKLLEGGAFFEQGGLIWRA